MHDSKNPKFDNDLRDESSESSDSSKGELWIDRYLLPAIREFTLLPLLLVVIGVVVAFVAPALVFGVRDRSFGSMVSLAVIAFLTVQCIRFEVGRHGRPDVLTLKLDLEYWASYSLARGAHGWIRTRLSADPRQQTESAVAAPD